MHQVVAQALAMADRELHGARAAGAQAALERPAA
jgi:hypothetical protein